MYLIKSKLKNFGINLPTSLNEITPEILTNVLNGINVPDNYCIVALVMKAKLVDIVLTSKSTKQDANVSISVLMGKMNKENFKNFYVNVGDKLVIERSGIERGTHLTLNLATSQKNVSSYLNGDSDLIKDIMSGSYNKNKVNSSLLPVYASQEVCIIEFKIVPVCEIRGSMNVDLTISDPFKDFNKDKIYNINDLYKETTTTDVNSL